MITRQHKQSISYHIEEIDNGDEVCNINALRNKLCMDTDEASNVVSSLHNEQYHHYKVRELMTICDYYGVSREIKMNKLNKEEIIEFIVSFEHDIENADIVYRRQTMWFYLHELKNDKFMKKFIFY